ncbi:MAG: hypothetical protein EPO23_07830 [Xanthobacteraceae bacterium]|nr:MAG: hypothetical protein EPO23_07830 [Xanthobacteraceae bacterium]
MQNILPEPPPNGDFARLEKSNPIEPIDVTAAALASQLQREQDHRKTERFFWVFACSMMGYAILVKMMDSNAATAVLSILLVVFLLGAAAWLGVDHVVILLERIFSKWVSEKK